MKTIPKNTSFEYYRQLENCLKTRKRHSLAKQNRIHKNGRRMTEEEDKLLGPAVP